MTTLKKRTPYFDNVKGILVILVVLGHLLAPIRSEYITANIVYRIIYSFHMPLFVLLTGIFSKRINRNTIIKLSILYIISQSIMNIFLLGYWDPLEPMFGLWYLMATVFYKLLVPKFFDHKYGILLALVIGLLSGYFEFFTKVLTLQRLCTYLVFFVIGYKLSVNQALEITSYMKKKYVWMLFILMIALFIVIPIHFDFTYKSWWFAGYRHYRTLLYTDNLLNFGFVYQLGIYVISSIMIFIITSLVTKKHIVLVNYIGRKSLVIYLVHIFIVRFLKEYGYMTPEYLNLHNTVLYSILLIGGILLLDKLYNIVHFKIKEKRV